MIRKIPILLTYGAIASLCLILLTLIMYRMGPQAFVGGIAYLGYAIVVVAAVVAGLVEKRGVHGAGLPFSFRAALRVIFGVIVLGLAVQTVFNWVLLNIIDTPFKHALIPIVMAKTEATYRWSGTPEDQLTTTMAAERASDPFGPPRM